MSTSTLATTIRNAAISTVAAMIGRSLVPTASKRGDPDALDVEDPLEEHRAAQQLGEVETEDRHHRHQRRAQGVPQQRPSLAEALRARRAHEVLVERLHHRPAAEARVVGRERHAEHQPGEQQPLDPRDRAVVDRRVVAALGEDPRTC